MYFLIVDWAMRAGAELVGAGDSGAVGRALLVGDHWRSRFTALGRRSLEK
jgi:hypothetical protein